MPLAMMAQLATTNGPDGRLKLSFDIKNGVPQYAITYDGKAVLADSPLGFTATVGDFSKNIRYKSHDNTKRTDTYELDRSKVRNVSKESNVLTVHLENAKQQTFDVVFCVSNNDVALRYEIQSMADRRYEKKMSIRITGETTGFRLPDGTTTFLCPQSDAMVGWKGTKPSYEEEYKFDEPMQTRSAFGHGFTFPCLFHVGGKDAKPQDEAWVLISETGVGSQYCASHLSDMQGDGLYTIAFPMPEENNGNGTIEPAFALPGVTPWRTITIGSTLKPLVETTVPWDYVEPLYTTDKNYKYGKGTWSWIVWQDASINYDDQVKFIDLAHDMGYEYVLIDNWWDTNIGHKRMEDLVKYAHSKNVDVFLWHSSSGYWNDIEQGPINLMDNVIARKREMKWLKEIGVKGVKIDFFGGDKQETMRLYEEILSDAEDYGLMVIFHGCTLPRGWERMYPNFVGAEAVLASENLVFDQHHCDLEAKRTALHPFLRNTVGCMEFGGSFMNRRLAKGNERGTTRRTTDAHEMAQAVMFQNPIQNFAITPENLLPEAEGGAPEVSMQFLRDVPTTWDETVFLDGYPGKYCVLARRHGDTWYIAGNNATGAPLTLSLSLPMLSKGDKVQLYSDRLKDSEPQLTTLNIKNPQKVSISMAKEGGFVIVKGN